MGARFLSLAVAGTRARYRLSRPFGWVRLLGAILDPYVYAGTVYFVLATVFRLDGLQRFYLLLVGVMAFRWALSSFLAAGALGEIRARMAEHMAWPHLGALVALLAPQAFVFCLSLLSAIALALILNPQAGHFRALHWLPFLIAVQGVWTAVVVSLLDVLRRRGWNIGNAALILLTSLLWILSPVMYTFEDIPEGASGVLTSYNPASHLLAGYHNALWFGQAVSLDVLPAAGLLGLLLLVLLARSAPDPSGRHAGGGKVRLAGGPGSRPRLVCIVEGARRPGFTAYGEGGVRHFARWGERLPDWTGEDIVSLIAAVGPGDRAARRDRVRRIGEASGVGRLFGEYLIVYPDWALSHLAYVLALDDPQAATILDGVLDDATAAFAAAAWHDIQAAADAGYAVALVAYRRPRLPPDAAGTCVVAQGGGLVDLGEIGPDLNARLARFMPPEVRP